MRINASTRISTQHAEGVGQSGEDEITAVALGRNEIPDVRDEWFEAPQRLEALGRLVRDLSKARRAPWNAGLELESGLPHRRVGIVDDGAPFRIRPV